MNEIVWKQGYGERYSTMLAQGMELVVWRPIGRQSEPALPYRAAVFGIVLAETFNDLDAAKTFALRIAYDRAKKTIGRLNEHKAAVEAAAQLKRGGNGQE